MTDSLIESAEQESAGIPIRERYGLVLLLILIGYLLAGFDSSPVIGSLNAVLWMTLLLATLWSPGVPERIRRVGIGAIALVLVASIILGVTGSDTAQAIRLFLLAIAQLAAMLAIVIRVTQHPKVTSQTVMGAVAGYALIAFLMAAVYRGMTLLTGTTFLNGAEETGDYIYFSFITLTTVGYGDITPATELAKRLVVVEAFFGQVFLITLVARLVALWGRPNPRSTS